MSITIITTGISCSGKSTIYKFLKEELPDLVEVNLDNIRSQLFLNGSNDLSAYQFSEHNELLVTQQQATQISIALQNKKDIMINDTHLDEDFINRSIKASKGVGEVYLLVLHFNDINVAISRGKERGYNLSLEVLKKQVMKLNEMKDRLKIITTDALATLYKLNDVALINEKSLTVIRSFY